MKQRRFDQFTQMFLVNVSQMAYLEEAHETQSMLQQFIELFRYFNKTDAQVNLTEEMIALKNYADLQKVRYGDRFDIVFADCISIEDISIKHLTIIDFFDHILSNALVQYEKRIVLNIQVIFDENARIQVTLEADSEIEVFGKVLMEEVGSCV